MWSQNLVGYDLNALKTLFLLYETGSVSKAAEVAGITQPSMSRALQKLRDTYDDRLFVRHKDRLVATPKTEMLVEQLQPLFLDIVDIIQADNFTPEKAEGLFHFRAPDIVGRHLMANLVTDILATVPLLDFQYSFWTQDTDNAIREGSVDLAFGFMPVFPSGIKKRVIGRDRFAVLHRHDHPYAENRSLEAFAAHPHILLMLTGIGKSIIDSLLAKEGFSRRIAIRTPEFESALGLLAGTDHLLTAPLQMAKNYQEHYDFTFSELPFDSPEFEYCLYWGSLKDHNPLHQYMRQLFIDAFERSWPRD